MNKKEANEKILEIMNKLEDVLYKEEIQLFKKLIFKCDLKIKNHIGYISLMYAFSNNKTQHLNLNEEQWDYLIKNSDLKIQDNQGYTPLMFGLTNNKTQNLNLSSKQFKTMYKDLDEKKKQKTFQKLIHENVEDDHQYLEEINLLLYNFKFQPNEETINWLKENNHQDILEMIKKRDLFFQ